MEKQKRHRRKYSTDLTYRQWKIIEPLVVESSLGRKRTVDTREVLNAIFYLLKSGCSWRMLPNDYPNWKTVYTCFTRWKQNGTWKKIHDALRIKVRQKAGKKKQPTAGIIDSQSVKTTKKGDFVAMTLVKK